MRSKSLFLSNLLLTLYALLILSTFYGPAADDGEALGQVLGRIILKGHIIGVTLGTVFGWIGFFKAKSGFALAAAISMLVGSLLAFSDFQIIGIVLTIFAFIGWARQSKRN